MKRIYLIFALLIISMFSVEAKEVSPEVARGIAREVLGVTRGGDVAVAWDSSVLATTRSEDDAPTFYVVAAQSGCGFVIVAGDDAIAPILAYSRAMASPIPDDAPVTTTTLLFNAFFISILYL